MMEYWGKIIIENAVDSMNPNLALLQHSSLPFFQHSIIPFAQSGELFVAFVA
jgi:hypothetical protein